MKEGNYEIVPSLLHQPACMTYPRRVRVNATETRFTARLIGLPLAARRAHLRKPLADAQQQAVADLAIGLQLLFAIAFGSGRIMRRPILYVGRQRACQLQRPVMRLRR